MHDLMYHSPRNYGSTIHVKSNKKYINLGALSRGAYQPTGMLTVVPVEGNFKGLHAREPYT